MIKYLIFGLIAAFTNVVSAQEIISYESVWRGKPIPLKAELYLPKNAKPPYPTIITIHGSGPDQRMPLTGGQTDIRSLAIKKLATEQGFAVILLDSFTERNIVKLNENITQMPAKEGAVDVKKILAKIHNDPRLDKNNFFFTGHSWGGSVSMRIAYKSFWKGTEPFNLKGVVSDGPTCQAQREENELNSPLLLTVGEKDERTPAKPCFSLVDRLKQNPQNKIGMTVIPGMNHAFSTAGSVWFDRGDATNGCADNPVLIKKNGDMTRNGRPFSLDQYYKECVTKGTWTGGNHALLEHNAQLAIDYFKSLTNIK